MLGKIWGCALVILGLYVAYEVSYNAELMASIEALNPKQKSKSSSNAASNDSEEKPESSPDENSADQEAKYILVPKTKSEIIAALKEACEEMKSELEGSKIPAQVYQTTLRIREKRLETTFLKEQLSECFGKSASSSNIAELEIFSSDFAGENAAHQIQIQASLIDRKSKNKIFEVGRKFEMAKKNPSLSTRVQK